MLPTTENPIEFQDMVHRNRKSPADIIDQMGEIEMDCLHAAVGVSGESGELLDAIKKMAIYNRPVDRKNVIEELGDIEFYSEQLRQALGITRTEVLEANMEKLRKRYPAGFTNEAAQARADKEEIGKTGVAASSGYRTAQDFEHPNPRDK